MNVGGFHNYDWNKWKNNEDMINYKENEWN